MSAILSYLVSNYPIDWQKAPLVVSQPKQAYPSIIGESLMEYLQDGAKNAGVTYTMSSYELGNVEDIKEYGNKVLLLQSPWRNSRDSNKRRKLVLQREGKDGLCVKVQLMPIKKRDKKDKKLISVD